MKDNVTVIHCTPQWTI